MKTETPFVDPELAGSNPSGGGSFLPSLRLLRRKKFIVFCLFAPMVLVSLIYYNIISSPLSASFFSESDRIEAVATSKSDIPKLTSSAPEVNALAGHLPTTGDQGAMILTDDFHLQGTNALVKLKAELEAQHLLPSSGEVNPSTVKTDTNKFDTNSESVLLLLQALKDPEYQVGKDWKDVYITRKSLGSIFFGVINSGPQNKFTELLYQVGLVDPVHDDEQAKKVGQKQALDLYRSSRQKWVDGMRERQGLTVFSKSYCPYSQKAKQLLHQLGANYTVYEVDLRPDAKNLQPLLAHITGHSTFPNVLAKDRLLGGSDDLAEFNQIHALKGILKHVGAL